VVVVAGEAGLDYHHNSGKVCKLVFLMVFVKESVCYLNKCSKIFFHVAATASFPVALLIVKSFTFFNRYYCICELVVADGMTEVPFRRLPALLCLH